LKGVSQLKSFFAFVLHQSAQHRGKSGSCLCKCIPTSRAGGNSSDKQRVDTFNGDILKNHNKSANHWNFIKIALEADSSVLNPTIKISFSNFNLKGVKLPASENRK
jgi:hypothetical protein